MRSAVLRARPLTQVNEAATGKGFCSRHWPGRARVSKVDGMTMASKLDGEQRCGACTASTIGAGSVGVESCLAMQGVMCRLCATRCAAGAIRFRAFAGGYACPEIRADLCDACGRCAEACPAQALSFG